LAFPAGICSFTNPDTFFAMSLLCVCPRERVELPLLFLRRRGERTTATAVDVPSCGRFTELRSTYLTAVS
jgi:hypothetical protein